MKVKHYVPLNLISLPNLFQHNQKHLILIPSQRGHSVTVSFRQSYPFLDTSTKLFWLMQQDEALSDVAQNEPHTEELVFTINMKKHGTCFL